MNENNFLTCPLCGFFYQTFFFATKAKLATTDLDISVSRIEDVIFQIKYKPKNS